MKKNIAIISGGDSSEWVVSKKSAQGLLSFINSEHYNRFLVVIRQAKWSVIIDNEEFAIDKNDFSFQANGVKTKFDFAYITIHGTPGENGLLQGYFELIGIPYSSCDVLSSALTFNKFSCNRYLETYGISTAKAIRLRRGESVSNDVVIKEVSLPCFIKPNVGGSSFGVTKVKCEQDIQSAIEKAFDEGEEVIIESLLTGTEVTCGCYKTKNKSVVFPITEVVSKNEFFDFEAKYNADFVEEITPARIPESITNEIQALTSRIYDILGCKGIIRIDYIISEDKINLLEVNTTPGMTSTSFIPQQISAAGLDISIVMQEIIENEF
ncbi:MAG: D-alanine--D-alanine ligase [Bacteroidales bacterium]